MCRMSIREIANMPTTLRNEMLREEMEHGTRGFHESLLRSYHIAKKVRALLVLGTPAEVILEMMDLMESDFFQPYAFHEEQYKRQNDPILKKWDSA